jgi:hypothetical protein
MLNAQYSMLKTARQMPEAYRSVRQGPDPFGIGHRALSIDESANGSTVASMG